MPLAKVAVSQIDPKNLADAIKNNQIDALFVAGAATGWDISNAVAAATVNGKAPSFIEIDQADGIAKRNPAFDSIDIDAGTFGGTPPSPNDSLKSLSFAEYLVARKSYNDSVIAALSKVVYSTRQALAAALPGDVKIAGAVDRQGRRRHRASGRDGLSFRQSAVVLRPIRRRHLLRLADLSAVRIGDCPAWRAICAATGRTRRLRLLQRVLDLVRKAHAVPTIEAIDQLQVEADNLVVAIIHQGEHEEFDETVRMSFAFALDQLRFAIAARRDALAGQAGAAAGSATAAGGATAGAKAAAA